MTDKNGKNILILRCVSWYDQVVYLKYHYMHNADLSIGSIRSLNTRAYLLNDTTQDKFKKYWTDAEKFLIKESEWKRV